MLINLRGTNGAGKSTVIRELRLTSEQCRPIYGALGLKPEAYQLALKDCRRAVFVIGPYTSACGGCDAVQPFDLIPLLIEKYAARGHVIFEGIVVSGCYGVIGKLMERWGRDALVVFLATSVEECIGRVKARRLERGDDREFDPKLLIRKHATIARLKQKIEAAGILRTEVVSSASAASVIIEQIKNTRGSATAQPAEGPSCGGRAVCIKCEDDDHGADDD